LCTSFQCAIYFAYISGKLGYLRDYIESSFIDGHTNLNPSSCSYLQPSANPTTPQPSRTPSASPSKMPSANPSKAPMRSPSNSGPGTCSNDPAASCSEDADCVCPIPTRKLTTHVGSPHLRRKLQCSGDSCKNAGQCCTEYPVCFNFGGGEKRCVSASTSPPTTPPTTSVSTYSTYSLSRILMP